MADPHREEIAKLESLYANNPEGRVFTHLAEAYRKSGDLERARGILEDGLRRHSDYSSAHVVLGRVLADMGQAEAASAAFRRVLELDRHNLVALRSLGEITMSAGRTDEALQYYRELQTLDPSDDRIRATVRTLEERRTEAPAAPAQAATGTPPTDATPRDETRFQPPPLQVQPTWTGGGEPADEPREVQEEAAVEPAEMADAFDARPHGVFGGTAESAGDEMGEPQPEAVGPEPDDVAGLETGWGSTDTADRPREGAARSDNWEEDIGIELEALPGDLGALADRPAAGAGAAGETGADADEWMDDSAVLDLGRAEREAAGEQAGSAFGLDEGTGGFALDPALAASDEGRAEDGGGDDFEPTFGTSLAAAGVTDDASAVDDPGVPDGPGARNIAGAADAAGATDDAGAANDAEAAGQGPREGDGLVTETMAELYFAQGFYDRAAEVYRSLVRRRPTDGRLADRLREAEAMARPPAPEATAEVEAGDTWLEGVESAWTGGGGVAGGETTPYAWAEQRSDDVPAGPAIGEFFRSLLSWAPGAATAEPDAAWSAVATEAPAGPPEMDLTELDLAPDDEAGATDGDRPAVEPPDLPEAASVAGADEEAPENDEDLEMFRSWLQSLKK